MNNGKKEKYIFKNNKGVFLLIFFGKWKMEGERKWVFVRSVSTSSIASVTQWLEISRIKSLTFPLCYLPLAMPHRCAVFGARGGSGWQVIQVWPRCDSVMLFHLWECSNIFRLHRRLGKAAGGGRKWGICIITFMGSLHNLGADLAIFIFNRKTSPTAAKRLSLYIIFDHQKVSRKVCLTILYDVCVLLVLGQCVSG